jgi:thymidylate synthase (FAD)
MKLIKPKFEILQCGSQISDIIKHIELCSRTCYKSEDKITDSSAKEFVERLIKSGHGAMLEHGTVYLDIPCHIRYNDYGDVESVGSDRSSAYSNYTENKYSKVELVKEDWATEGNLYITTNYRVLVENRWLRDLKYLCKPTEYHEKRFTVKFLTDRGITHEFVRHRAFSFAQESTRQWRH